MAFGPSITFVAPNWEPTLLRSIEPKGNRVPVEPFRSWLKSLGFVQHPGPGNNFTLDAIDIYVHPVEEEVIFTTIDFGAVDDAPERISNWQKFVEQLCSQWGFCLTDREKRVPLAQFRRVLAQDSNWQLISDSKGWPPIWTPAE
jgi:hypothetical protein